MVFWIVTATAVMVIPDLANFALEMYSPQGDGSMWEATPGDPAPFGLITAYFYNWLDQQSTFASNTITYIASSGSLKQWFSLAEKLPTIKRNPRARDCGNHQTGSQQLGVGHGFSLSAPPLPSPVLLRVAETDKEQYIFSSGNVCS